MDYLCVYLGPGRVRSSFGGALPSQASASVQSRRNLQPSNIHSPHTTFYTQTACQTCPPPSAAYRQQSESTSVRVPPPCRDHDAGSASLLIRTVEESAPSHTPTPTPTTADVYLTTFCPTHTHTHKHINQGKHRDSGRNRNGQHDGLLHDEEELRRCVEQETPWPVGHRVGRLTMTI